METDRYRSLELEEDLPFQQTVWRVERVGWVFMALIVLASLLGLIGKGGLGRTRAGDPAALQVEYDRFVHRSAPAQLCIRLSVAGPFSLRMPFQYLRQVEVSRVMPRPLSVSSQEGVVTYLFAAVQGSTDIVFDMTPRDPGTLKGFVESDRQRIDFAQFVYP